MSSAALAKKRRANAPPEPRPVPAPTPPTGLTLPQVIALVDLRLTTLEKKSNQPEMTEEYESRFQTLANEIMDLKDMLLKLQTFTMEVNAKLMQRVPV